MFSLGVNRCLISRDRCKSRCNGQKVYGTSGGVTCLTFLCRISRSRKTRVSYTYGHLFNTTCDTRWMAISNSDDHQLVIAKYLPSAFLFPPRRTNFTNFINQSANNLAKLNSPDEFRPLSLHRLNYVCNLKTLDTRVVYVLCEQKSSPRHSTQVNKLP